VPPKGKKKEVSCKVLLFASFLLVLLFGFDNHPFIGKYYLVDSGYPNRTGYLAPFKGTTYHIPEFHLRSERPPQGKYEMFNF